MRLLPVVAVAACGGASPRPSIEFAGDPIGPATPSADVALTALAGGEIPVSSAWSGCKTSRPLLSKSDKEETHCESASSSLVVTCTPACKTVARDATHVIVTPPAVGKLVITATAVRDSNHEQLTESRAYDIVVPDDLGLLCRDIHGHVQECDVPNDPRGTVEVVAYVHGKIVERLGGMRVDGKDVGGGAVFISDVVDSHVPGPHTVEITGGGLTKRTVIAVAQESR